MITDLGSRNGSVVGGAPLAEGQSVAWEFGQQLAIGPYLLCHERDVPSVEASEAVEADGTAMLARMMVEEVLGDQAQAHSLVVIAGPNLGQWLQIAARDGEATIGRGQEATLQLSDADVSRIHARLVSDRQGMLWLEDLHSKNGVRIGGESISERVTVTTGDEISLGQTVLRYGETVDVYLESLSRQEPLPLLQAGVPGNVSQVVARPSSSSSSPRGDSSPVDRTTWFVFGGLLLGVLVTLTSVGAGAIGVAVLSALYPALVARRIVGTDIVHAIPLAFVSGIGHLGLGNVDWVILTALLCGSIPGIALGSRLTGLLPEWLLRLVLSVVLLYAAYLLLPFAVRLLNGH